MKAIGVTAQNHTQVSKPKTTYAMSTWSSGNGDFS